MARNVGRAMRSWSGVGAAVDRLETLRGALECVAGHDAVTRGRPAAGALRLAEVDRRRVRWKQALDRHDVARIQGLVDQGVLQGLYAIDEPHDWPCGPSFADIDAACAYAGQKWPKLKCGVNAPPGWLRPGRAQLGHLGFLFFQYASGRGDPRGWLAKQMADADWFHGDIWLSIQLLKPRLSVSEFRQVALQFCGARPAGLLMWKWSEEWFAQPGVLSAMQEVATACGSPARPATDRQGNGAP